MAAKRRATARGAVGEIRRRLGTMPARVSWPPTQRVAAVTWRKRRIVVHDTGSTTGTLTAGVEACPDPGFEGDPWSRNQIAELLDGHVPRWAI